MFFSSFPPEVITASAYSSISFLLGANILAATRFNLPQERRRLITPPVRDLRIV